MKTYSITLRDRRWFVLCASFLIAVLGTDAGTGAEVHPANKTRLTLTLHGAVQLALTQNPEIQAAKEGIRRTRGMVVQFQAKALPHISINGDYEQEQQQLATASTTAINELLLPAIEPAPGAAPPTNQSLFLQDKSWRIAVQATQVVYSGGQVAAQLTAAELAHDQSFFELQETANHVIATVRKQFDAILLVRQLIDVQKQSILLLQSESNDVKLRMETGRALPFNVLRIDVELSNAESELLRLVNRQEISYLELAKTLGMKIAELPSDENPFDVTSQLSITKRPEALESLTTTALENRPFLKSQQSNILIQQQQVKSARSDYQPKINFGAGYADQNVLFAQNIGDTANGWFFGIQGSWDIFDSFETRGKVIQATSALEAAKINYGDALNQVALDVRRAFSSLKVAAKVVESQRKNVEEAQEALRLAKASLLAGKCTQTDLLDARVAFLKANVLESQALFEYNAASADLDCSVGAMIVNETVIDVPLPPNEKAPVGKPSSQFRIHLLPP